MVENKTNIEELFQKAYEDFRIEPRKKVWQSIYWKLVLYDFLKFNINQFNIYYLAGFIILSTSGILLYSSKKQTNQLISKNSIATENVVFTKKSIQINSENNLVADNSKNNIIKNSISKNKLNNSKQETILSNKNNPVLENNNSDKENINKNKTVIIIKENSNTQISENQNLVNEKTKEITQFQLSQKLGCAPLLVKFNAPITDVDYCEWNFGDGTISNNLSPNYIYETPGKYIVTLKIIQNTKLVVYQSDTIVVNATPVAAFEVNSATVYKDKAIEFLNKSQNSNSYLWSIGNQTISTEKNPVHRFKATGTFDIKLKVVSTQNCTDSVIVRNLVVNEPKYVIIFPQAFTPDLNGPNGGFYQDKDRTNFIFHPIYKGVSNYELRIYSRSGFMVFKTNNIQQGWDGYYNNKLMPQDVYVWKSIITFSDGSQITKAGDVTLILKK